MAKQEAPSHSEQKKPGSAASGCSIIAALLFFAALVGVGQISPGGWFDQGNAIGNAFVMVVAIGGLLITFLVVLVVSIVRSVQKKK